MFLQGDNSEIDAIFSKTKEVTLQYECEPVTSGGNILKAENETPNGMTMGLSEILSNVIDLGNKYSHIHTVIQQEGETVKNLNKSALELEKSLEIIRPYKGIKWVLGDFNYPKFTWDTEHVPTIQTGCGHHQIYEHFISLLDDHNFVQMVNESTRNENTLDLFLTSNNTLVNDVQVHPGISDHNIFTVSSNLKPATSKQIPRDIPLYRKTDWDGFRNFINDSKQIFFQTTNINQLMNSGLSLKILFTQELANSYPLRGLAANGHYLG